EARADDSAAPVDLLSLIDDSSKGRGVWVTRALAILAVLLGVTILAIPVLRQRAEIQQVLAVLDAARSQAEYASRLRQEIDELEAARSALHGRQRQAPDALQIFHALTILLPDDT